MLNPISEDNTHQFIKTSFKKYEVYKKEIKSERRRYGYDKKSEVPEDYLPNQNHGRYDYHPHDSCVPIVVSISETERVLKLLNILLINLEMNGFRIYISKEQERFSKKMIFEKDEETMTFNLRQGYNWKKLEQKNESFLYTQRIAIPNNNFTLDLIGLMKGGYKSFKTSVRKPLEKVIEEIFDEFLKMPSFQKIERERKEEERLKFEEERRISAFNYEIIESQKQQFKLATEESLIFHQRELLKKYLTELEKDINHLKGKERDLAILWIEIVKSRYERNNPIRKRLRYFSKLLNEDNYSYDTWFKKPIKE